MFVQKKGNAFVKGDNFELSILRQWIFNCSNNDHWNRLGHSGESNFLHKNKLRQFFLKSLKYHVVGKDVTWGLNYPQVVHIVISGVGFGYNGGGIHRNIQRQFFKKCSQNSLARKAKALFEASSGRGDSSLFISTILGVGQGHKGQWFFFTQHSIEKWKRKRIVCGLCSIGDW